MTSWGKGRCSICDSRIGLYKNGNIYRHNRYVRMVGLQVCPGSGKKPQ